MPTFEAQHLHTNPNIHRYVNQMTDGVQARALALKRISTIASLKATGIAKTASICNFNPVCLRIEGGINYKVPAGKEQVIEVLGDGIVERDLRFEAKVPSMVDPSVPESLKLEFPYQGRRYKASIVTLRDPHLYPKIIDVYKTPEQDLGDGRGVYDIAVCKQIEIAHAYWTTYNVGAHDSSGMGGVLMFEGDQWALKSDTILVPQFVTLPNGAREYYAEPRDLGETLAECLDTQKRYYDNQMQIGQSYHDDPDQRKNITMVHRIWAQWGLDMGFREKPVDWLLSVDDPTETCDGCGSAKKRALAYFCHACARPYDPFRAYMDKELPYESAHMGKLTDEQWPIVNAEEQRRRSLRLPNMPPPEPPAKEHGKGK
jgi:hypothetical protein